MTIEKELRDFIRSHEMMYFVDETVIHKAYKVNLEGKGEYWVWFSYGRHPYVLNAREVKLLLPTLAKAKAIADKNRSENKREREKKKMAKENRIKEATNFLANISRWDIVTGLNDNAKIKPEYEELAEHVKRVCEFIPRRDKGDMPDTYIDLLSHYIRTGMIYSQGIAFRKEQVVSIKYGSDESVQVELVGGTKITPVSRNVTNLIKLVFGENIGGWTYSSVNFPTGEHDKTEKV